MSFILSLSLLQIIDTDDDVFFLFLPDIIITRALFYFSSDIGNTMMN